MEAKECRKCSATKPVDEFYKSKTGPGGRDSYCKACRKEVSREYEQKNRQHRNEYHNKYYHEVIKPKRNK